MGCHGLVTGAGKAYREAASGAKTDRSARRTLRCKKHFRSYLPANPEVLTFATLLSCNLADDRSLSYLPTIEGALAPSGWPCDQERQVAIEYKLASSLFGVGSYDHLLLHQTAPPTSLVFLGSAARGIAVGT